MDDITRPPKSSGPPEGNHPRKLSHAALDALLREEHEKTQTLDDDSTIPPDSPEPIGKGSPEERAPDDKPKRSKKPWVYLRHMNLSRKQKILLGIGIVILLVAGGLGARALYRHFSHVPPPAVVKAKPKPKPKPTTEPSRLTGLEVPIALNKRPVTGVIIENSPDARPQSGLKDAGVVFEAIAEGGITRFLALYQEAQPDYIGPIRSVRPYYLDFLLPFDASIAHVGGAPQALEDIRTLGVKDLDQFANSAFYTRVTQRYAPHNVYSSIAKFDELQAQKGFTTSSFTGFARKKEAPNPQPAARTIDINISGLFYNVHYDYDPPANAYKRSEGGKPHTDERSGAVLEPKVVVVLVMSRGIASDGQHTEYGTVGTGQMFVFQDGSVTGGTWHKADRKAQFSFTDNEGHPLKLNPGQTWVTIADPNATSFKP